MAERLTALLKKLEKSEKYYDIGKFEEMSAVWHDITENPNNYALSMIGTRTELRQIGHREIPRRDQLIEIYDNDFYDSKRSKLKIPEFDLIGPKKEAAVVEIVEDAYLHSRYKEQVKIIIKKYLIKEK